MFFFPTLVWYTDWMFFFIFIAKNTNVNGFFFSNLLMSLILTGNLSVESNFLAKSMSTIVILDGWWFSGFRYQIKHHSKHSLSSIFWILINPFFGWSNSSPNFIKLLPAKGLYFEIQIVWSMIESMIQP